MKARYASWCAFCDKNEPEGRSIQPGDEIKRVLIGEGENKKERWIHSRHKWSPKLRVTHVPVGTLPILVPGGRVYHRARYENSYNNWAKTLCGKNGWVARKTEEKEKAAGMSLCAACSKRGKIDLSSG